MTDEIKVAWRSAWIAAAAGLLGALIGAGATAFVNDQNLDAQRETQEVQIKNERDLAVRDQRRPVYLEFDDAANVWATRQATVAMCTDLKLCRYDQSDLDDTRYRLQSAVNEMHIYASEDALRAAVEWAGTMPPTLVGVTGHAAIGDVDEVGFRAGLRNFSDQMCVDVSLAPDDCAVK